jgi:cell division protein FtsB
MRKRKCKEQDSGLIIDMEAARNARRQNRESVKAFRRRAFYGAVFLTLALFIGVSVFGLISLKLSESNAKHKLNELVKERDRLSDTLSHVDSDQYIEQQARQKLMMIFPGEVLYVLTKETDDNETD